MPPQVLVMPAALSAHGMVKTEMTEGGVGVSLTMGAWGVPTSQISMDLLVDIGNTCLKWCLFSSGTMTTPVVLAHDNEHLRPDCDGGSGGLVLPHISNWITTLELTWGKLSCPRTVLVSSVVVPAINQQLTNVVSRLWGLIPNFIKPQQMVQGLMIAYQEPTRLGVDRWLAMLAARKRHLYPALVVDCGTTVTIDVLDHNGNHAGGLIALGLTAFKKAIFTNTAITASSVGVGYPHISNVASGPTTVTLPDPEGEGCPHISDVACKAPMACVNGDVGTPHAPIMVLWGTPPPPKMLGNNTAECIAAGALQSIVGLIERVYAQLGDVGTPHAPISAMGSPSALSSISTCSLDTSTEGGGGGVPHISVESRIHVVLTGGDAQVVSTQLTMSHEVLPGLVLEGLCTLLTEGRGGRSYIFG